MKSVDSVDYFLIGLGILLLPAGLIGILPIGIAVYRIGSKMEKHQKTQQEIVKKYDKEISDIESISDSCKYSEQSMYSQDTLEEMK